MSKKRVKQSAEKPHTCPKNSVLRSANGKVEINFITGELKLSA